MEFHELLQKLKKFGPSRYLFTTQYVNSHWAEEFHKKRTALFFKNKWNGAIDYHRQQDAPNEVVASLRRDRELIEEHMRDAMRGTIAGEFRGLAYFACSGKDFFEVLGSFAEFEDQLVVAAGPHLRQLLRLADEYEPAMLIMIDASRARVYELNLAGVDASVTMADDVPGRHKAGGWSQMRFQRHVDVHHNWHYKDVADEAVALFDRRNLKNVVIAGQEAVIADFVRFLPKRLLDKVFVTVKLDMIEPENTVVRKVLEHLQQHERHTERRGVHQAVGLASIGGKGTVGLHATLRAVNERAVRVLYLSENFDLPGKRCRQCRLLTEEHELLCPICSGELEDVSLVEEMTNDVAEAGGDVDVVAGSSELDSFQGVAAQTRYEKAWSAR